MDYLKKYKFQCYEEFLKETGLPKCNFFILIDFN